MVYLFRRALVVVLSICLLFTSFHAVFAEVKKEIPADLKSSWASKVLQEWWAKEWIHGYPDETFRPDTNISRAEFITLVNRVLSLSAQADISFRDLHPGHWAYDQIAIAFHAGYMKGYKDGTVRPDSAVSREEVAFMVNTLLQLDLGKSNVSKFKDAAGFASWSKAAIGALAAEGILSGYPNGMFRPENKITRAEAVVVLNNAMQYAEKVRTKTYDKTGVYGTASGVPSIVGSVTVASSGITLQNMLILGDLIIDGTDVSGNVTLQNVIVRGKTHVYGGVSQVNVVDSTLESLEVCMKNDSVRIVAEGTTDIHRTALCSSAALEERQLTGGGFHEVSLVKEMSKGSVVELIGAFDSVIVDASGVKLLLEQGTIQMVTFGKDSGGSNGSVGKDTTVVHLVLDAVVSMSGQGMIDTATLNSGAAGSSFERRPGKVDGSQGSSIVVSSSVGGGGVIVIVPSVDTTPPNFLPTYPKWATESETTVQVLSKANKQGRLYAIAVLLNEPSPTAAQVKAGKNSNNSNALSFSQIPFAADAEIILQLNGLTAGTDYDIYVVAEDNNGNIQSLPTKGSVKTSGVAPLKFVTTSLPSGKVGIAYALTIESLGGIGTRSYALTGGSLPVGMSFSSKGVFAGTPVSAGTYSLTLRVSDEKSASADQTFSLVIDPPEPLKFVTTSLPSGKVGVAYALTIESSGGIGTRSYALAGGSLPVGMAFTSKGVFTGTPLSAGTYSLTLRVSDDQSASANQTFSLVIDPPEPLKFITTSLPSGKAGVAYALTIESSGGIGTRSYALASGSLPVGMAFTSKGVFTGTPVSAGTYSLTLRVSDEKSASADQTFSLVIDPPEPLMFVTTSLPSGKAGVAYAALTIESSGGIGTRSYALASGSLPAGMSFTSSGVFAGTPTMAGTYSFIIKVTDSQGVSTTQSFSFVVNP
ncbi:putative Ig domain-containing protein [Paenibacillus sp. GCM10027626]|uniref:putative Ig domain-containing protein n=1 Tax=Paenibacillus sp. GCM10027626 TaxID=3273411 RepID=UPI00362A490B